MITVLKIDDDTIYYSCTCGVYGKCILKPLSTNKNKITYIECPNCYKSTKVVCSSCEVLEENKKTFKNKEEDIEYAYALVIVNNILDMKKEKDYDK